MALCCSWYRCSWTTASVLVAIAALAWYLLCGCCGSTSFDPKNLAGKRVVICGASSGIGAELAYEYARLGARIVLGARREEKLRSVTDKCKELGAQSCDYVLADFSGYDSSRNFYEESLKKLQGVDVLVLNHAVFDPVDFHKVASFNFSASMLRDLYINFVSYAQLAIWFYPQLRESSGRIAVVSSVAGISPAPYGFTMYSASKHAIHGFFETMDFETRVHGRSSNISTTICVLGPNSTEMGMSTAEYINVTQTMEFYPADETARRIIAATEARRVQLFYPTWVYWAGMLNSVDIRITHAMYRMMMSI